MKDKTKIKKKTVKKSPPSHIKFTSLEGDVHVWPISNTFLNIMAGDKSNPDDMYSAHNAKYGSSDKLFFVKMTKAEFERVESILS